MGQFEKWGLIQIVLLFLGSFCHAALVEDQESAVSAPARETELEQEEMPELFDYLRFIEFGLVCFLALGLIILALFLTVWVVSGCYPEIHSRVIQTIKGINVGWKVALLILIPLFFRPIYKFLFYLKKGPLGMERGQLPAHPVKSPTAGYEQDDPLTK